MYKRILVPADGSATSLKALESAIGLAKEFGGQIRVIHVLEQLAFLSLDPYASYSADVLKVVQESGEKIASDAVALVKNAGVAVDSQVIDKFGALLGDAVAEAAKAWPADLIVLGTHGRRGVGRLLMGSGAEQVIRLAPVPVLVIRADDAAPAQAH
ncbi:MAG: universal stress protein [Rhodoferax sp.]|jgi:nucleotide-binding universal stress UspA family protein